MKKNKRPGFTAQNVRDLNHLPSKPRGIRLPMPPDLEEVGCSHPVTRVDSDGDIFCTRCKRMLS
jgi:hypothetical protein